MQNCESSVATWIIDQLTLAESPIIERVYSSVRVSCLRAIEENDRGKLATTKSVCTELGLSRPQIAKYMRELIDEGRVRSFTVGRMPVYVPADTKT
jgi:hypothetical protein